MFNKPQVRYNLAIQEAKSGTENKVKNTLENMRIITRETILHLPFPSQSAQTMLFGLVLGVKIGVFSVACKLVLKAQVTTQNSVET